MLYLPTVPFDLRLLVVTVHSLYIIVAFFLYNKNSDYMCGSITVCVLLNSQQMSPI